MGWKLWTLLALAVALAAVGQLMLAYCVYDPARNTGWDSLAGCLVAVPVFLGWLAGFLADKP
jgi:hypothetical protein